MSSYLSGKKRYKEIFKKGKILDRCASLDDRYLCCNMHVIKTVSNCPFECSYCFLQNYLTDTQLTVVTDISAVIDEIRFFLNQHPNQFFRIGNWELGDSLAMESVSHQAAQLIAQFTEFPNALLDLRTKSNCIDSLLSLNHQKRTVVSWTLSPQAVIDAEEHKTASLKERLAAIYRVTQAGYLTAFHFDPMIVYPGWEIDYVQLAKACFEATHYSNVAWISIGSLRFNPEMKKKIEINFPTSKITSAEMITGDDHKMRYVKPIRSQMYQTLYQALLKYGHPSVFTYLCMERWDMWEKVFGYVPSSIDAVDAMITESLSKRFDGLVKLIDPICI